MPGAAFDPDSLLARRFPVEARSWNVARSLGWARDFGAGLPGALLAFDAPFLDASRGLALPMIAVPLCDGEFWQQRPETGIDWRRIVHAEEVLHLHRPLPLAGDALLSQSVVDIRDRGADKGASMVQRFSLQDAVGLAYADLDVTTVLLGNGGFGEPHRSVVRPAPLPDRQPDARVEIRTPAAHETRFCLSAELRVAGKLDLRPGQRLIRGVGCFGLAGRAALALGCDNDPSRVQQLGVRYGGPMLTDETMCFEFWSVAPGQAVFRMRARERDATVLSRGFINFLMA